MTEINYQETSREAWLAFLPESPTLDEMILATLKVAAKAGLTCHEIETTISRTHQAVSGNLRHLVERRLVKHNGQFGLTPSGRRAMKWSLGE